MDASDRTHGRRKLPLYLRVLLGALIGAAAGRLLGPGPLLFGHGIGTLAEAGMLVVRVLKLVATPLILFSVLDAVLSSEVRAKSATRLLTISAINALVAIFIALGCAWGLESGRGQFPELNSAPRGTPAPALPASSAAAGSSAFLPENLIEPFRQNSVLGVALLAVAFAIALRAIRGRGRDEARQVSLVAGLARAGQQACLKLLGWVIELLPFAVAVVIAGSVSRTGPSTLHSLAVFAGAMILGLLLHAIVYYGLVLRFVVGRSPQKVLKGLLDALLTALSCGSSAVTLPVTLGCLNHLGIRRSSAQLAAAAGTNLNHDGIILYEAAATLFVAQALGVDLSVLDQLRVAGAAVLAGIGMAGVPEAGLVTLPLVLAAGGIPAEVIAMLVPLILPVDWIIGRFRAATNVASDATVAILLDHFTVEGAEQEIDEVESIFESAS